jgi:hypothetical protein
MNQEYHRQPLDYNYKKDKPEDHKACQDIDQDKYNHWEYRNRQYNFW